MRPTMRRCRAIGYLTATVVVVASLMMPAVAWARYRASGSETNTFATHVLLAPPTFSCGLINVLSVTLSWTAPTDSAFALSYEVDKATSSGGTYTFFANVGTATSVTFSAPLGDQYFVVRSVNHQWRGALSPERHVFGAVAAATCS